MSAVLAPFRELVRRRLWPVALLLIVAAVAAPIFLGDDGEPSVAAATPGAIGDDPFLGEPIVAAAGDGATERRRRVLGAPKDPFRPTGQQPRPASTDEAPSGGSKESSSTGGQTTRATTGGGTTGGGTTGGAPDSTPVPTGPPGPLPTVTPVPAEPKPALEVHSLRVRVDGVEREEPLSRLTPLPTADDPAVIYLGLLADGKTAVFLLDVGVTADGDGTCHPSPSDCQRVYLKKGDSEFFDVTRVADVGEDGSTGEAGSTGGEFQLDLLEISTKKVSSTDQARSSFAWTSSAGRRALRSRMGRAGRLGHDARTGKLRRLSHKAWRASVAHATRAAASG